MHLRSTLAALVFVGSAGSVSACGNDPGANSASNMGGNSPGGTGNTGGPSTSSTGGTDPTLVPNTGPVAIEQLAHELAVTTCMMYGRCFPGAVLAACVSSEEKLLGDQNVASMQAGIAAGKISYDGATVRACLDLYPKLECDYSNVSILLPTCTNVWGGTVAVGGSCNSSFECASNAFSNVCRSANNTCPGVCAAKATAGEPCASLSDCDGTLKCVSAAGTCKVPLKLGDTCSPVTTGIDACGGLTQCVQLPNMAQGQCVIVNGPTAGQEGAVCNSNQDCQNGLVCSATAEVADSGNYPIFRCRKVSSPGSTCWYSLDNPCSFGQYCPMASNALTNSVAQCTAQKAAGQACSGTSIFECAADLDCTNGTCQPALQRLSAACVSNSDCYSFNCVNSVCTAPVACVP
jgi:hypothetical protein